MNYTSKLLSLFATGIGITASLSCSNSADQNQRNQTEAAVQVTIETVAEEEVTGINQFPGTVVPLQETELRAEVNGYITAIYVADGATVSKGQKLYEIDHTRYQATQEQAKANLAIAQSNLERVKLDVGRYRKLAEQDAIARQILDNAEAELNNMEAQVLAARASVTTATTDLNRSVITAPFSGTVGISLVRTGALVSAGTTLLNTISSTHPIAVDFQVNERYLERFVNLQKHPANFPDSSITIKLTAGNPYPMPGRITAIDRAIDAGTGTITVRATFPNPDGVLRAGMNTLVTVLNPLPGKQLTIPYKAIEEQLASTNVYVVDDSSRVQQRGVRLGIRVADKVVIEEGLQAGERIVTDGIINLRHGAKVTTEKKN